MVRTVATAFRASGGKSSKAAKTSTTPRANISSSNDRNTGGNTVCPRETPTWQKPITNFFTKHVEHPPEANISEKFEELNIERTTANMECLGEGCSTANNIENNCEFLNKGKSDNKLDSIHGKKNNEQIESNENTDEGKNKIPAKKQKLDFYKHLQDIEQI